MNRNLLASIALLLCVYFPHDITSQTEPVLLGPTNIICDDITNYQGWQFEVNSDIQITALGARDNDGLGLDTDTEVAIFEVSTMEKLGSVMSPYGDWKSFNK